MKLHIGCGQRRLPGWVNIDLSPSSSVDLVLDVRAGLSIGGASLIFAEHFLEHLSLDDGLAFLTECRRVLAPDGCLRLSTPNLDWVMVTHYHLDQLGRWASDAEGIRDSLHVNRAFRGWGHKFLYNRPMLTAVLRAAGFADLAFYRYGESGRPELGGLEGHETCQDLPVLPHVLVAEASGCTKPRPLPEEWLAEFRRDLAAG